MIDLTRVCPLRFWHLSDQEQLAMIITMSESAGYEPWEVKYGFYLRIALDPGAPEEVVFVEPDEVH